LLSAPGRLSINVSDQSAGSRDGSKTFLTSQFNVVDDETGKKLAYFELGDNPSACLAAIKKLGTPIPRIASEDAFKLHDTYGFPIDLTRIMAEERGMTVDLEGYEKLMEEARNLARAGGKGEASTLADLPPDAIAKL